jgi:hypothetical protein
MKKSILVPTDLTGVAAKAIEQAIILAKKTGTGITLLHVLTDHSPSREEVMARLREQVPDIRERTGKECEVLVKEGSIFEIIPQTCCDHSYDLMVIGTHGKHGIRQLFFCSDILRMVKKICIPAVVVQENAPLVKDFRKLIMPVSSHTNFRNEINSVVFFSELFSSEVHLYSIYKPGFEWPEQMLNNIREAENAFESKGIKMIRVKEEQEVYSAGYARQTIKYAGKVGADIISMISKSSEDYYFFAQADKEALLLNEHGIPVLCTA